MNITYKKWPSGNYIPDWHLTKSWNKTTVRLYHISIIGGQSVPEGSRNPVACV